MPLRQGCERSVISTQSRRRLLSLVVLLLSLGTATPCLSASDRFLADKPSPLELARPGNDRSGLVHFTGNARPGACGVGGAYCGIKSCQSAADIVEGRARNKIGWRRGARDAIDLRAIGTPKINPSSPVSVDSIPSSIPGAWQLVETMKKLLLATATGFQTWISHKSTA
jgi:hypothetical protein